MASFSDLRNQIPMPKTCPFCGKILSVENAELDHIIPPRLGGTNTADNLRYVCKECNRRKADKYDPLLEYYIRLMKAKGMSDESSSKKIDFALRNMSENDLTNLIDRVEKKDASFSRIMAYAKAFAKVKGKEIPEPSNDELADLMNKTLKSYDHYDIQSEIREEINGNIFTFKKDFPVDKYREILTSYGEDEQGEVYSVYLDEEGRLVVY